MVQSVPMNPEFSSLSLDLIKVRRNTSPKVFQTKDFELTEMIVGGREGKKFHLKVEIPFWKDGVLKTYELFFVVKEVAWSPLALSRPEDFVKTYFDLYTKGYPVPATVRYFQDEGRNFIAMSDMKENNAYWLWGYNDYSLPSDNDDLRAMNLTYANVQWIKSQVLELEEQSRKDTLNFEYHNYQLRKHKETGELSVILLDILPRTVVNHRLTPTPEESASKVDTLMRRIRSNLLEE